MDSPTSLSSSQLIVSAVTTCMLVAALIVAKQPGYLPLSEDAVLHEGPDFANYPAGPARKQAFFDYFLPIVERQNEELRLLRQRLLDQQRSISSLSRDEIAELQSVARLFRIRNFDISSDAHWDRLLKRVDIVPPSLALAQAANESAWGTSRFAMQGNNYFGQWCFTNGCGIVPARRESGKSHEVAAFESPVQSVEAYMQNINSHSAYERLRDIRETLRDEGEAVTGHRLVDGLEKYSERGDEYIKELKSMIRYNQLAGLDQVNQG